MPETWSLIRRGMDEDVCTCSTLLLGRNDFGLWLAATADADPAAEPDASMADEAILVPPHAGWLARWRNDGSIVARVTTIPVEEGRSIHVGDRGVSVERDADGQVTRLRDQLAKPHSAADELAASELAEMLRDHSEPFGEVGQGWLSGITRNALHFVPYDPTWPERFLAARAELIGVLPGNARVEHIGSTAVPGLAAKDCIDIAVVLDEPATARNVLEALSRLGYEWRPNAFADEPPHWFLRRVTAGRRTEQLHVYPAGHPDLAAVLAFRDLLRTDPDALNSYQRVKRTLAEANPLDRGGYMAGKDAIVAELTATALQVPRLSSRRDDVGFETS